MFRDGGWELRSYERPFKLRSKQLESCYEVHQCGEGGTLPAINLAIPAFGYKSHISIDRRPQLIRRWKATDASAHDEVRVREGLLDRSNTGSAAWVATA